jgi:hypothetical protein
MPLRLKPSRSWGGRKGSGSWPRSFIRRGIPPPIAASRWFNRAASLESLKGSGDEAGGGPERVDLVAFDQDVRLRQRQVVGGAKGGKAVLEW